VPNIEEITMKKMPTVTLTFMLLLAAMGLFVPAASAKTHKDNFAVPCDVLWRAVKDAIRNSGKYGVIGIDNEEMTASYNIGGTLGGKRTNSVILNKTSESTCEMQTQTAYTGLAHNDAGDFKERVEKSLAKLSEAGKSTPSGEAQPSPAAGGGAAAAANAEPSLRSADLKNGQSIQDVEQRLGKPQDTVNMKDSIVYIYPSGKVVFEKGQVVEVQYRDAQK
jgi:hypothetical protein